MKKEALEMRLLANAIERELAAACTLAVARGHPVAKVVNINVRVRAGGHEIRVGWPPQPVRLPMESGGS